jgi:hypothetical protein
MLPRAHAGAARGEPRDPARAGDSLPVRSDVLPVFGSSHMQVTQARRLEARGMTPAPLDPEALFVRSVGACGDGQLHRVDLAGANRLAGKRASDAATDRSPALNSKKPTPEVYTSGRAPFVSADTAGCGFPEASANLPDMLSGPSPRSRVIPAPSRTPPRGARGGRWAGLKPGTGSQRSLSPRPREGFPGGTAGSRRLQGRGAPNKRLRKIFKRGCSWARQLHA